MARGQSETEKKIRERIAAHLRRKFFDYIEQGTGQPTQQAFADWLGVNFSTVSHILRTERLGAGFDVMHALRMKGVTAENLLMEDPPAQFFKAIDVDGRIRRYAGQHLGLPGASPPQQRERKAEPPVSRTPAHPAGTHGKRGHG
jgi:hypothetical protein